MTVKRGGIARSKRVRQAKRGDNLSTTPTQYGETSPDYARQTGDPDFLRSFSEEQISLLGGRESIATRVAAKERRAAQSETLSIETPSSLSLGPDTPPTTYGVESVEAEKSIGGSEANAPVRGNGKVKKTKKDSGRSAGSGKRGEKGGLYGRLAKAPGAPESRRAARSLVKGVRKQIRAGNKQAAARRITRALSGGPKAKAAGQKISNRIAQRQRDSQRGQAGGGGGTPRRKRAK